MHMLTPPGRVVYHVVHEPGISRRRLAQLCGLTAKTLSQHLVHLLREEVLLEEGVGRAKRLVANLDYLDEMGIRITEMAKVIRADMPPRRRIRTVPTWDDGGQWR